MYHVTTDPEYQSLIPPLAPREYDELTKSLQRDGCREPLSVMEDVDDNGDVFYVLLDGHNRFEICEKFDIGYRLHVIRGLMSRDEIRQWIIGNQLCRRNLTPEQIAYYRGEQYKIQRRDVAENLPQTEPSNLPKGHNDLLGSALDTQGLTEGEKNTSTADIVAENHSVSPSTVKRDAQYAEAVDRLVSFLGPEFRRRLLAHKTGLTKKDVLALGGLEDKRLQVMADRNIDVRRCAKIVRRELAEAAAKARPVQLELCFVDSWRSRLVEAREAHENGDQDTVSTILAELLDQAEEVLKRHAS